MHKPEEDCGLRLVSMSAGYPLPCVGAVGQYPNSHVIELHSREQPNGAYQHEAKLDNAPMEMFDYTWRVDPGKVHDEVKDTPAES